MVEAPHPNGSGEYLQCLLLTEHSEADRSAHHEGTRRVSSLTAVNGTFGMRRSTPLLEKCLEGEDIIPIFAAENRVRARFVILIGGREIEPDKMTG